MRRLIVCLLTLALMAPAAASAAPEAAAPVLRALIVTCDRFLSQEETTPAAQENARLMAGALAADARGYAVIRTECDTIGSAEAFYAILLDTFSGAGENDISVLYISTHGVYNTARSNLTAELLLCDGTTEDALSPQLLESMLASIPGTHVLLMDACHSGAFIGKGLSNGADAVPMTGPQTRILCSAGGSEDSWYWRSEESGALHGAGYFTSILTRGLDTGAGCPADNDRDGRVTLREAFTWLRGHYAVSTPQAYPEYDDAFVLFACGEAGEPQGMTEIDFEETVFSGDVNRLRFSYTLHQPMRVAYQLVYMVRGAWDFRNAAQLSEPDTLQPGVYERQLTLRLADEDTETSGYLMLQIFSLEDGSPALHDSRLISVLPLAGDIALGVECRNVYRPGVGREFPVTVRHDIPCLLTVQVQNIRGDTVRYLAYEQPSRPQHLVPEGTCLYWDGLLADGSPAPSGYYVIRVQTDTGGAVRHAYSTVFRLLREDSAG